MAPRLRYFTRIKPPTFYDSMVEEDPQEFNDEIFMIIYVMELSTRQKAKFATYKLKDVAQELYVQWRDNKSLRHRLGTWEVFKRSFLNRFFPREKREYKVLEFINLSRGGISVNEYSWKFNKLSKYSPSMVSDPRDEFSLFWTGMFDNFISHLMVNSQYVEEARAKRNSRDAKREISFYGGS
ncbi:uncharacterized protein [Solanum lycopersicum]|uniref:uncharacterized protein n=1 Tax=Solanum lycopersicum TaxID=4081 RepID=UPI003749AD3A